jgi:hypothetical protein
MHFLKRWEIIYDLNIKAGFPQLNSLKNLTAIYPEDTDHPPKDWSTISGVNDFLNWYWKICYKFITEHPCNV